MKKMLFYILLMAIVRTVYCQQQPTSSQYVFNKYFINPAFAGSTTDIPIAASYRQLWAGIRNAPSIQFLTSHLEVANRMGVGLQIYNVSSGPLSRTGITATYAYHIPLNSKGDKLAFGLSGLLYQYKFDKNEITLENPDDEAVLGSSKTLVPDATFGTYYYTEKYYVGLTVSQMFQRKIDLLKNNVFEQRQVRHYYLNGGYKFDINDFFSLEPSVLLKLIEAGVLQADVNVIGSYKDNIWGGLCFRPMSAFVVLLGYKYAPVYIGYSFDMNLTDIRKQSYGSHEILLIYSLPNTLR